MYFYTILLFLWVSLYHVVIGYNRYHLSKQCTAIANSKPHLKPKTLMDNRGTPHKSMRFSILVKQSPFPPPTLNFHSIPVQFMTHTVEILKYAQDFKGKCPWVSAGKCSCCVMPIGLILAQSEHIITTLYAYFYLSHTLYSTSAVKSNSQYHFLLPVVKFYAWISGAACSLHAGSARRT